MNARILQQAQIRQKVQEAKLKRAKQIYIAFRMGEMERYDWAMWYDWATDLISFRVLNFFFIPFVLLVTMKGVQTFALNHSCIMNFYSLYNLNNNMLQCVSFYCCCWKIFYWVTKQSYWSCWIRIRGKFVHMQYVPAKMLKVIPSISFKYHSLFKDLNGMINKLHKDCRQR